MSESTETAAATVTKMEALKAYSLHDLATRAARMFNVSRSAFAEAAKCIVCVIALLHARYKKSPTPAQIFRELAGAGVKESDFKNGQVLAGLWPVLVTPGVITENVFDTLTFQRALEIRAVIRRETKMDRGLPATLPPETAKLVAGLIAGKPDELTCYADHGLTVKAFNARQKKLDETTKKAVTIAAREAAKETADKKTGSAGSNSGKGTTAASGKKKGKVVPISPTIAELGKYQKFLTDAKASGEALIAVGDAAVTAQVTETVATLAKHLLTLAKAKAQKVRKAA